MQLFGVDDHHETFAPVFQIVPLCCLLVLALRMNLEVPHVDVETVLKNSPLKYNIWVKLPSIAVENGLVS